MYWRGKEVERRQEACLEGWERGSSKGICCEEEREKRKVISLKRIREEEEKKNGRGGGGGEVAHGKEVKTLAVEVVEGGFLVTVSRENRSSSPSSSNKRSVFWGVFGEAFGCICKERT